jgi:hypothetical protein
MTLFDVAVVVGGRRAKQHSIRVRRRNVEKLFYSYTRFAMNEFRTKFFSSSSLFNSAV